MVGAAVTPHSERWYLECGDAVEAIGGDPATVAELVATLRGILGGLELEGAMPRTQERLRAVLAKVRP